MRFGVLFAMAAALPVAIGCSTKENPDWVMGSDSESTAGTTDVSSMDASTTDAGSTTGPGGTTTGTDPGSTSDAPVEPGGTSTGEQPLDPCNGTASTEQEFLSLPESDAMWDIVLHEGATAEIVTEQLHVGVSVDLPSRDAYWTMTALDAAAGRASIIVEIEGIPNPNDTAEVYFGLTDDTWLVAFDAFFGKSTVEWLRWSNRTYDLETETQYDQIAHRWVRMSFDTDAATARFDTSPDTVTWTPLGDEIDISRLDFSQTRISVGIGAWAGPVLDPDLGAIDSVFVCEQ